MAVAHSLVVIVYVLLTRQEPYQDLGPRYFEERDRAAIERHAVRRLQSLGYHVSLTPSAA